MTEFKIKSDLLSEIEAVKTSAENLNDGYEKIESDDVNTLKTAMRYIEQHKQIKKLLSLYESLLLRDVSDMNKMVEEIQEMDRNLSV